MKTKIKAKMQKTNKILKRVKTKKTESKCVQH